MEKKRVESILIVILVLGVLAGQSAAKFTDCYKECFVTCLAPGNKFLLCGAKCLKDCIIKKPSTSFNNPHQANTHYFCKLGCASTFCTKLSSKQDPAEEKVEGCVDSCSEICTKN